MEKYLTYAFSICNMTEFEGNIFTNFPPDSILTHYLSQDFLYGNWYCSTI